MKTSCDKLHNWCGFNIFYTTFSHQLTTANQNRQSAQCSYKTPSQTVFVVVLLLLCFLWDNIFFFLLYFCAQVKTRNRWNIQTRRGRSNQGYKSGSIATRHNYNTAYTCIYMLALHNSREEIRAQQQETYTIDWRRIDNGQDLYSIGCVLSATRSRTKKKWH